MRPMLLWRVERTARMGQLVDRERLSQVLEEPAVLLQPLLATWALAAGREVLLGHQGLAQTAVREAMVVHLVAVAAAEVGAIQDSLAVLVVLQQQDLCQFVSKMYMFSMPSQQTAVMKVQSCYDDSWQANSQ